MTLYTLADYSAMAVEPLKKGVIDIFRRESVLLDKLTWANAGALETNLIRTKTLPDVAFRKIGAPFTESKGRTEKINEGIKMLGGFIDIPKEYIDAKASMIADPEALQVSMFVQSMAYAFQDKFINGNPITSPDELVGIWYRLVNDLAATQSINAGSLDVSPDAAALAANQLLLIEYINSVIRRCDQHSADALLMGGTMYERTMAAIRNSNLLGTTVDSFGRKWETWGEGGPMIVEVGTKADQTTEIMGVLENANGAVLSGGAASSIYAVKFNGSDKYVSGFQLKPMDVIDIGLLESGVAHRTIVDWGVGIYFASPRAIARIYGIVAA